MPLAGFEPTIPAFKRAKTFHALDRAATVTGEFGFRKVIFSSPSNSIQQNNFQEIDSISDGQITTPIISFLNNVKVNLISSFK
jgi:hypothetical protein